MIVEELIEHLTDGEFDTLNVGLNKEGGPTAVNHKKLISSLNRALLDIYKEFPLKYDEVYIKQFENINRYHISSKYAVSNTSSNVPYKWVIDTPQKPFDDRIILIDAVYNEMGEKLSINDRTDEKSVFTTSTSTIEILNPSAENMLSVLYRRAHEKLTYSDTNKDWKFQEVDIPMSVLDALVFYMIKVLTATHASEDLRALSNMYDAKYQRELMRLKNVGVYREENPTNLNLERNGWV